MRSIRNMLLAGAAACLLAGCGGDKNTVPGAMETIEKNKEVHVLTEGVNAPFEFADGTGFQGMGADVGVEIAKTIGQPLKWIKSAGVAHMFDALKQGSAEMIISSVASDPAKSADFAFSESYYDTGDVIAHHRSNFSITDLASLTGKKVGVVEGHPADAFMANQKLAAGVVLKKYKTIDEALGYLNRQEIDAVVGDEILLIYSSVKSYQNTNILNTIINPYSYAVAVRKADTALLKKINETIKNLKSSGELAKMEEKWVGNIKQEAEQRAAGDREQEELKKSPKSISVSLNKRSGSWNMERLDGFQIVLQGANGSYRSTPILTEGNHGNCRFSTPVPPGKYSMNFSILGMTAEVNIPASAKKSLAMELSIANGITITVR